MEWWITGVLLIAVIILISIYRISLRENRQLTDYLLLLILNDEVYKAARINLSRVVASADANNPIQLNTLVSLATGKSAANMTKHGISVAALLWQLRKGKSFLELQLPSS